MKEQEKIRALLDKVAHAIDEQNWEIMSQLCSDDWEHFTHFGDRWDLETMKIFFQAHISDHIMEFSDIVVQISGDGRMAWAKFNEQSEYKIDGNPIKENAIFTAIFKKENTDWQMVLFHRSAPPPPLTKT